MRTHLFPATVFISLLFIGCKAQVGVSVTNNSGVVIDSVLASVKGQKQIFKTPIPINKEGEFDVDFSDPPKGDGLFTFVFYLHGGGSLEYSEYLGGPHGQYNFNVSPDSVKVDHGIHLW